MIWSREYKKKITIEKFPKIHNHHCSFSNFRKISRKTRITIVQRHDDRGVINSRIIPMNSRERENGENGGEKRGEEERRRKYRRRRRRITFDDDDDDDDNENNRTVCHAAKRWLRESRTVNLVILRHTIRDEHRWRKGLSPESWWRSPNEPVTEADANKARCMRHLLINTKPPADWLVAVRTFTSVVDASRTSLYRFSKRRFRSNFGPPGCLPPLDSRPIFPPFFLSVQASLFHRIFVLWCKFLFKIDEKSFENIVIIDRNARILKRFERICTMYPRVCRNLQT